MGDVKAISDCKPDQSLFSATPKKIKKVVRPHKTRKLLQYKCPEQIGCGRVWSIVVQLLKCQYAPKQRRADIHTCILHIFKNISLKPIDYSTKFALMGLTKYSDSTLHEL